MPLFRRSRVQQPVQPVVGELVAADGAFIPCLLGHAADAAVVPGSAVTGIVVQVLCELTSADARQPVADIVRIRQLFVLLPRRDFDCSLPKLSYA